MFSLMYFTCQAYMYAMVYSPLGTYMSLRLWKKERKGCEKCRDKTTDNEIMTTGFVTALFVCQKNTIEYI